MKEAFLFAGLVVFSISSGFSAAEKEFSGQMMQSTFFIEGNDSAGTGFMIAKKSKRDPKGYIEILITANHVLQEMKGEQATLFIRKRDSAGVWTAGKLGFAIRKGKIDLWIKHPRVDVAAMRINIPKDAIASFNLPERLIDDALIERWRLHPGDKLFCLGFPLALSYDSGMFPYLRSGTIASYPLTPTDRYSTFTMEFPVFKGDSGGPVYLQESNRFCQDGFHLGEEVHGIVGIVVQETGRTIHMKALYENKQTFIPMQLAQVVHARFIREVVESVPEP